MAWKPGEDDSVERVMQDQAEAEKELFGQFKNGERIMTCNSCMFWEQVENGNLYAVGCKGDVVDYLTTGGHFAGICRRLPPQVIHDGLGKFPLTRDDAWCGEYKDPF